MSRSTRMHGSFGTERVYVHDRDGAIKRDRNGEPVTRERRGWWHRSGWKGHAHVELSRRRRRNKAARAARKRNRRS